MKILRIEIEGTVPFRDRVVFDATKLGDAKTVAIVGVNGSGKSTLAECVVAATRRKMPSRGSVAEIANGPDCYIGVTLETDREHTFEIKVDATKKNRPQTAQLDGGGWTGVDPYDVAVDKILPPLSTYLASAFGSQTGAGNFMDAEPGERRAVLARLIGAERWQERAVRASEKLRAVQAEKAKAEGKRAEAAKRVCESVDADAFNAVAAHERAVIEITSFESVNEMRKSARYEYDGRLAELKAQEAGLIEQGKALRATYDLACVAAIADWKKREEARVVEFNAAVNEARNLSKALTDLYASEHAAWKTKQDQRGNETAVALSEWNRLADAAKRLASVPCGGDGAFAACPLIASAVEAGKHVDAAKAAHESLLTVPIDPEPQKKQDTPEILAALARRDAATEAEPKPETPEEPAELIGARQALVIVRQSIAALKAPEAETDLAPLRKRAEELSREVARLEEVARASGEAKAQAQEAAAEVARLAVEEDDWRELQKALGPTGVQALLVDGAAPEITSLCNDLLHGAYGSRFSVRLSTQAADSKGGVKEVCMLSVIDNEKGTDGDASKKSGGERVLIGEALASAICVYHKRRAGIGDMDIVRDECAGALDADNARAYVGMLRALRRLMGDGGRVYFVSHVPELWTLADARVKVAGGKVEVEA